MLKAYLCDELLGFLDAPGLSFRENTGFLPFNLEVQRTEGVVEEEQGILDDEHSRVGGNLEGEENKCNTQNSTPD